MCPYLSMQIFSTWGTSTCRSRMIVCRGSLHFHERTWGRNAKEKKIWMSQVLKKILKINNIKIQANA